MAKQTRDTQFRKVNVDKYCDDTFHDEDPSPGKDVTGPNEAELLALINQKRYADALKLAIENAPLESNDEAVKEKALSLMLKVILAFKTSEIDAAISSLDSQSHDTLMKYIYRGFETPMNGSSAQLLTWHQKVVDLAGVGCIVRVLTDRHRV